MCVNLKLLSNYISPFKMFDVTKFSDEVIGSKENLCTLFHAIVNI